MDGSTDARLQDSLEALSTLERHLRRYRLDTALQFIAAISADFGNPMRGPQSPEPVQERWGETLDHLELAYLTKALIQQSNDYRGREFTAEDLLACDDLFGLIRFLDAPVDEDEYRRDPYYRFRIAHRSMQPAGWEPHQIARTLFLFQDLARRPKFRAELDIGQAFHRLAGIALEDFVLLGEYVCVLAWGGLTHFASEADLKELVSRSLGLDRATVDRFLAMTAADYRTFRDRAQEASSADARLTLSAFNPLIATPIIRTVRSGLVVPVVSLLQQRVSTGIYYDLMGAYHLHFSNLFGRIFEAYVGDLLGSVYGPGELFPERPYGPGGRLLSTDWIVVEGDDAVLLECKVTRLTRRSKAMADPAVVRADLAKGVVKALKQLARVMRDILSGVAGLEEFRRLRSLVPVVLVLDPYYMGNMRSTAAVVNAELEREGVEPFGYQIISVGEIEPALDAIKRRGLARLLKAKMAGLADTTPRGLWWAAPGRTESGRDYSDVAIPGTAYWDFDWYLERELAPEERNVNPGLLERYGSLVRQRAGLGGSEGP